MQCSLLKNVMAGIEFTYINLGKKHHAIFPELMNVIHLLLVIPATSATSERTISSLRLVKNFLRSTIYEAGKTEPPHDNVHTQR